MPSLTMAEASTRAADLTVLSYDVHLDLARGADTFSSSTTIEFRSSDRRDTFVEVAPVELEAVRLNGRPIDPAELVDGRLPLTGLEETNTLSVAATMAYSRDGEGLHRAVDPEDGLAYLYAMTFLPAAPRIFACFDQPDLKAPYRFTIKAPEDWLVLGNGSATRGEPGSWTLTQAQPLATYFVTIVAGPYHSIRREHDGIPLGLHCRQSLARYLDQDADELFEVTAACFDEYHRLFGIRYPFGEYHQVFVPEFNAGAMENPGCVTFTDELVFRARATDNLRASRAMVVAHEMAHQWFGDLVTMTWWDDLWLNESFAEYMGYRVTSEVTRFQEVLVEFALGRKAWGLAADQRRSTHPVAGNGARNASEALTDFDGISYTKGAASLRQLNAYLGDEAFLAGVVDHLTKHSFGNATFGDLVGSWQRASRRDVGAWADVWLRTSGVDTLSCEVSDSGEIAVHRRIGSHPECSRPHAITFTAYDGQGAGTSTSLVVAGDRTPVHLMVPGSATPPGLTAAVNAALLVPDSADQTWAKIELDAGSAAEAPRMLQVVDDPLARAVVWGALREGLRDARIDPDDYVAALEQALPTETDLAVEVLIGSGPFDGRASGLDTYFPRPDHQARLTALAERILDAAAPGSNRQLIAARQTIDVTADVGKLRRWFEGDVPDGLLHDDNLRWRILTALCTAGQADQGDIDALRAEDRSSQGALYALRAQASRPTPSAKEEAWLAITTDASLSNYELYALAERFFRPHQSDVTAQYVDRYFAEIPDTAAIRTGWILERVALLAFPRYAVDERTAELAESCLRRDDLPAGLRRSISDSTDDLERALRSRRVFGG